MPPLVGKNISILRGLDGQDNHIESLMALWEQLQLSAVEVAAQPECDLISFAQTAFFFGIITWGTHNDFIQPRVPSQTVTAAPQTNTMPWPASRPVPDPWSWEPEGSKTTDELLNKLEELKPGYDAYLKLQKRIESRPSEPQNVWKYGSNSDLESWFSEGQSSRQVQQAEPVAANSLPIFTPTLASVPIASTRLPPPTPTQRSPPGAWRNKSH
ncbi:hypothetical protein FB45DRAFT_457733 [Roridomyces roridus]|uniref:Uncharacterized protein n=1 Tax=Roridomyces roridus TaxID=1738132 RepID=A0AAD7C2P7_9AGAR|nr:hypothetical protein FB45DRAFT_457733 [Roridomyces roridus]